MADSPEEIIKAKRKFLIVGAFLFVGTVITVAVATIPMLDFGVRGFDGVDAVIGLAIAAVKASLVMLIFMHLNHEKPLIYLFYGLGIVMAFFCMWLIGWSKSDPIQFGNAEKADGFYNKEKPATPVH